MTTQTVFQARDINAYGGDYFLEPDGTVHVLDVLAETPMTAHCGTRISRPRWDAFGPDLEQVVCADCAREVLVAIRRAEEGRRVARAQTESYRRRGVKPPWEM